MAGYFAMRCIMHKEKKGIEVARKYYKKVTQKYPQFKEDIDVILM